MKIQYLILSLLLLNACQTEQKEQQNTLSIPPISSNTQAISIAESTQEPVEEIQQKLTFKSFERTKALNKFKEKIKEKEPLVAHILVPLCDNEHQGIVPVNASLGNGMSLKTNLYWGALYGVKTHFKKRKDWTLVQSKKDISDHILERVIFKKRHTNGTIVYLVADAYRGDKMKACLEDYFAAIAGVKTDEIKLNETTTIGIHGKADLMGFNGHNGLMDTEVDYVVNVDDNVTDAIVIACASESYFKDYLNYSGGYPLLGTTNLLAPEAYVLEGVLNAWASLKSGKEIRAEAGKAYHKYQKCGLKGATRLFMTGW